jgi:3-isopropylmalate/(R)-2-methylmalate dehydratase small subunit
MASMEAFTVLEGVAAPLLRPNINTDIIIRIERLRDYDGAALAPYAFESWRYRRDGSEDPAFVLNKPQYRDARIMIGGENFACGSSREAAVWALKAFGIRCVIAPSFGSIFYSNCFQNGVLPVVLPAKVVEEIAAEVEGTQGKGKVSIDLKRCVVTSPSGKETPFTVDALLREGMLEGLDQIALTRAREPQIAAFQARDRAAHPWLYLPPREA